MLRWNGPGWESYAGHSNLFKKKGQTLNASTISSWDQLLRPHILQYNPTSLLLHVDFSGWIRVLVPNVTSFNHESIHSFSQAGHYASASVSAPDDLRRANQPTKQKTNKWFQMTELAFLKKMHCHVSVASATDGARVPHNACTSPGKHLTSASQQGQFFIWPAPCIKWSQEHFFLLPKARVVV